jgi:enamine deaminase RidA (YjgF/YER057c/UK114 family)
MALCRVGEQWHREGEDMAEAISRTNQIRDIGVATRIGRYSDAVEVPAGSRLLFLSGTPGLAPGGELPEGIEAQAEQAWQNVAAALAEAGMDVHDLVKIRQYLVSVADVPGYTAARNRHLGDARPASMLVADCQMVWPGILVEIEAVAARR